MKKMRNAEWGMRNGEEIARELYLTNGLDFEADLREYEWPNGVIVDTGDCFGIAFATKTEAGEWCWFVKVAVGELTKLLALFRPEVGPRRSEVRGQKSEVGIPALPFISFCRSKSGKRVKTYRMERLMEKCGRNAERGTRNATATSSKGEEWGMGATA